MANSTGPGGLKRGLGLVALCALAGCGAPTPAKSPAASAGAASSSAPAAAPSQETVGDNAVVQSTVTTHSLGEPAPRPAVVRGPVRFLDDVATGAASALQVAFHDNSALSLGADTHLTVDRFVYDPAPGAAGVGVSVAKGVFRFASNGPGGRQDSESFRTPTAAIGIRGTLFDAAVGPDVLPILAGDALGIKPGDDPATAALIVLRQGAIEVRTTERTVMLRVAGQAVVVSGHQVSDPFYLRPGPNRRLLAKLPPFALSEGPTVRPPTPPESGPRLAPRPRVASSPNYNGQSDEQPYADNGSQPEYAPGSEPPNRVRPYRPPVIGMVVHRGPRDDLGGGGYQRPGGDSGWRPGSGPTTHVVGLIIDRGPGQRPTTSDSGGVPSRPGWPKGDTGSSTGQTTGGQLPPHTLKPYSPPTGTTSNVQTTGTGTGTGTKPTGTVYKVYGGPPKTGSSTTTTTTTTTVPGKPAKGTWQKKYTTPGGKPTF